MTHEETVRGNTLMAEFMGGVYKTSPVTLEIDKTRIYLGEDEVMFFTAPNTASFNSYSWAYQYQLQYNISWDWLMPVVEKIQKELKVMISINFWSWGATECKIYPNEVGSEEKEAETETSITSTWLAVLEFIKWYNVQSK
jgi:hypothetical protein